MLPHLSVIFDPPVQVPIFHGSYLVAWKSKGNWTYVWNSLFSLFIFLQDVYLLGVSRKYSFQRAQIGIDVYQNDLFSGKMISLMKKKNKTCETHIFIFLTHTVFLPLQYLLILNVIIRSIPSCKTMALLAPDNIFYFSSWLFPTWISASSGAWLHISVRLNALHIKLSIYPWIQVEFTSESRLDSLMITSLGCGNLDPGETCPNQGPANTTPTCWISFIQSEEFPPRFEIQEGSEWQIQSLATKGIEMKMFRLFEWSFVHEIRWTPPD